MQMQTNNYFIRLLWMLINCIYLKHKPFVMKKLYFILFAFLVIGSVKAQIINFSDYNFKSYLMQSSATATIAKDLSGVWFKIDSNNDGEIDVNEALQVSFLTITGSNINSISQITFFTNLNYLRCESTNVINLDLTGLSNLHQLLCSNNNITNLNLSGLINLEYLECNNNHLSTLDLNDNSNISYLSCISNDLNSLDIVNLMNLQQLYCSNNHFSSLNLLGHSTLYILDCSNNLLNNLDLTGLHLSQFNCANNQLSTLNLAGLNFNNFNCSYNHFNTLDLSNMNHLSYLYCSNNQITQLNLNGCVNLQYLNCSNNLITTLNFNDLTPQLGCYEGCPASLNISNNNLQSLFIKSGRDDININFSGNPNLQYVCTNNSQIPTFQNLIAQYGYVNCFVNSYCSFTPGGVFYTIQGNNRYDENNDGCNSLDINYPNLQLAITNGTNSGSIWANNTGNYSIPVQSGAHTITPTLENPTYFNISPTSITINFPAVASPYNQDFCITANGIHNDLEVTLLPIGNARPGFDVQYQIVFKNKGTNTQNGSINLMFNDAVIDYVSATPSADNQILNNLIWNFSNLAPLETRVILINLSLNSPTEFPPLNSGDILNYTASIYGLSDENSTDNVSILNQYVLNAFDPNYKTCTEGTTLAPSEVGKYVHYIIGFENDGTANAENIVVKDMIDTSKYDITTLVPIKGSAPFTTRIINTNQVEFIFQNINLPFASGSNQGYVAFKIKTKPTLVLGNNFSNTANIYFDYNAPIVTNTATTTIAALANPEFVFSDYFTLTPIPTKGVLNINTKQDIVISSISIYNTLGQVVLVTSNPSNSIDVSSLTAGSYFVKVITDKGSSSGKFLKE